MFATYGCDDGFDEVNDRGRSVNAGYVLFNVDVGSLGSDCGKSFCKIKIKLPEVGDRALQHKLGVISSDAVHVVRHILLSSSTVPMKV